MLVIVLMRDSHADFVHCCSPRQQRVRPRRINALPVHADVAGITLQIAPGDVIECNVPPYEPEFAVDIWRPKSE